MEVDFDGCVLSTPLRKYSINGTDNYSIPYLHDLNFQKGYHNNKCSLPESYIQTESTQYSLTQKIEMVNDPSKNITENINPERTLPVFLDLPIFVVFNQVMKRISD